MIAVMGSYDRPSADLDEPLDCYLHGYVSSRIMNLSRATQPSSSIIDPSQSSAPSQSSTLSQPKGLPVAISAAKVDGLILALTPNSHSYNYRSAILFGHATPVTDVAEKLYAMELITNKVIPNRWPSTRVPPNASEMSSTNILRVKIESGSAKVRDGPPADAACDLGDGGVLDRVWTGFVPLREELGEPVPSVYNRVTEVPEHVRMYREGFNKREGEYVERLSRRVGEEKVLYGDI
jgi:hypothetical protein